MTKKELTVFSEMLEQIRIFRGTMDNSLSDDMKYAQMLDGIIEKALKLKNVPISKQ